MARIPEDEIERLVMGFGIELKRQGAELVGRCPFHEDHTPSRRRASAEALRFTLMRTSRRAKLLSSRPNFSEAV